LFAAIAGFGAAGYAYFSYRAASYHTGLARGSEEYRAADSGSNLAVGNGIPTMLRDRSRDRRVCQTRPRNYSAFGGDNFVYKCAEESEDDLNSRSWWRPSTTGFPAHADKACGEKSAACQ